MKGRKKKMIIITKRVKAGLADGTLNTVHIDIYIYNRYIMYRYIVRVYI